MVKSTIRLSKEDGFKFAKNGDILCGIAKVGTWVKTDVWKENGGRMDKSGCRLVHYIWSARLTDGKEFFVFTMRELRNALDGMTVNQYELLK